ncbi:helix-turn-helix domain-containing protein [Streptomyces sp. NPDC050485]|uniref:helix-turn-helix domain-containing protein n=1 Tax=Streptomyces sp. NPDC050485 TaxID=3365617 RepID=UPI00379D4525
MGDIRDDDVVAFLALLAREAPLPEFDSLLEQARGATPPPEPDRLTRLETVHRLALEVQAQLNRRQQRAAGLSALVDTARDLTRPYDLDELLQLTCRRARRLLNLDMAYVSLHLPDTATSVVRAADGHASTLTVGFEVPTKAGIGAAATEHAAPFWTPDYLPDERIHHAPVIDEVIRAEGLRAVLAVPLRHGDSRFGVLYAADREVRYFTPDELSLMGSLGDLATVAIEKARLLDDVRASVDSLETDGIRSRGALADAEQVAETYRDLLGLILSGCTLHQLTTEATALLGGTVHIRNSFGDWLAGATQAPKIDDELLLRSSLDAHAEGTVVELPDGIRMVPIQAGTEHLGVLLVCARQKTGTHQGDGPGQAADGGQEAGTGPEAGGAPDPGDAAPTATAGTRSADRLLATVAQAVAALLVMQRSTAVAEGSLRDELLDDLVGDAPHEPRALRERCQGLGLDPDAPYVVMVIRTEGGSQGRAVVWASSHAHSVGGLKTVLEGTLTLLLPGRDPSALARRVAQELKPLLDHAPTVAAAGPVTSMLNVRDTCKEANRCLSALLSLGARGTSASAADLGFLGLLLSDHLDVCGFVRSAIGPVLDYDQQRSTELVRTLEAYFEASNSPTYAAEALYVHPNTVSRRLERIAELLGPDWQTPAQSLEIQLALRLHRTRKSLGH